MIDQRRVSKICV
jgi:hypothetical protein